MVLPAGANLYAWIYLDPTAPPATSLICVLQGARDDTQPGFPMGRVAARRTGTGRIAVGTVGYIASGGGEERPWLNHCKLPTGSGWITNGESRLWLGATDLLDPMAASPPLVGDHCDQPPLCMATFTPSRVGHYPLRVMVGHDAIPELLSAGGVVAGEPLRVVVTAWDEFANSIPCTPEAAKATFGLLWNGAPPRDPLIWSCIVEEHDPVYAGLLAPTTSSPVEWGWWYCGCPAALTLAGPWPVPIARSPSPRHDRQPWPPTDAALMAGQLLTVFVAARDAYGNPIACLMPGEAGAGATPIGAGNLTLLWDGAPVPWPVQWSCAAAAANSAPSPAGGASINGGSGGISGLISATQCDTSLQPSEGASLRAGSPCHVSVTARDAFANPVPCGGTSDPAAVFGLLWDGSASLAPSPLVWACNEEFVGTFSPLVAGPHEVALLLLPGRGGHDATLVAASNHTVQVVPDTIDAGHSTAVLPAQAQAGQPAPATMTARDQYDNLIGCIPATAGATFALVASCPLAGPTTWACAEGGTRFVANVTLAQTGTQSLRVGLAVGGDAVGAAGSVDVTPGPLWAGASSFTVVPATVPAGEPLAVRIVGRDRLANRIGCTGPTAGALFTLLWGGADAPDGLRWACDPAGGGPGADFVGTFAPLLPGSWELSPQVAPAMDQGPLAGANATVEVTAGTIDPGRSDFVAANQTEAGMPYTVLIHARSPSGYPLACYMANRNAFAVRWDH
ncbi:hypothetical protein PAPYR_12781 [Paratrimastix pyriformis]|uniref:Uncharacterized protein n=1 Tax=Paratrimastix pyriformis TaxID=342808 RepID=A0ABQ8U6I1_9EUKA|nr:hypothetical protein PAPYR_12781 [Paratrimastix pyriformis]